MKRLALLGTGTVAAFLVLGAPAAHAQGYGMAGCGLGSMAFGTQNTALMQILAATTNGTFASQTFGITSGTSNCVSGGVVKAQREQAAFAEVNFQDLKRNMASGGGEFLTSFATLLGCEDGAKPALAKMTQAKYESILPSEKSTPMDLVSGVKTQIKADPALAGSCSDERAVARAEGKLDVKVAAAKAPAAKSVALTTAPTASVK
ncbi:MAG TPA: DUF3015 domain-containing protein [Polyangia bacterium]|nr:DUF3015 domain-containing protein [Polyangia bacterium]